MIQDAITLEILFEESGLTLVVTISEISVTKFVSIHKLCPKDIKSDAEILQPEILDLKCVVCKIRKRIKMALKISSINELCLINFVLFLNK